MLSLQNTVVNDSLSDVLIVKRTISCLIRRVLDNDVCFIVFKVSKRQQNDIALIDPNLGAYRAR
jgi:hypothetical protein